MYIRSEESDQAGQKPYERQVWLPVANICVTGLLKEGGSTQLLTPFFIKVNPDGSEKVEYPSKPSDWSIYPFRCPSEGHHAARSGRGVLPRAGAIIVPGATNAAGQHGIGITWPSPHPGRVDQMKLIFDKTTLQNIGEEQFNAKTGAVDFKIAPLQRAFVDKAGELP